MRTILAFVGILTLVYVGVDRLIRAAAAARLRELEPLLHDDPDVAELVDRVVGRMRDRGLL